MNKEEICYLCGRVIDRKAILENEKRTRDHIPPSVFFPKLLRRKGVFKNLDKLIAHNGCNNKYKEDEEYVARVMALFTGDQTAMGNALLQEFVRHYEKESGGASLPSGIMNDISEKFPSGLYAPPSKLAVQVDELKMQNVMWKIARGIHFKHFSRVLPGNKNFKIQYFPPPDVQLPQVFEKYLKFTPTIPTTNPKVFIYKYATYTQKDMRFHLMIFLFWDCFIVYVAFHDLDCQCEECLEKRCI